MTQDPLASLLRELDALATMQTVIAARTDLAEAFTWQCVAEAIRDRRVKLLARADTVLRETLAAESTPPVPAWAAAVPTRRLH